MGLVICAFEGSVRGDNKEVCYIDSINFSKTKNFVEEYMKVISEIYNRGEIVIVSCHSELRRTLAIEGMNYIIAFPSLGLKEEYLSRYKDKELREFMAENWEDFICEIQTEDYSNRIVLGKDKYVEDILEVAKGITLAG